MTPGILKKSEQQIVFRKNLKNLLGCPPSICWKYSETEYNCCIKEIKTVYRNPCYGKVDSSLSFPDLYYIVGFLCVFCKPDLYHFS